MVHTEPSQSASEDQEQEHTTESIPQLRQRIDEIDAALIELWLERAAISQRVGIIRVASGGTRLASPANGRSCNGSGTRSDRTARNSRC